MIKIQFNVLDSFRVYVLIEIRFVCQFMIIAALIAGRGNLFSLPGFYGKRRFGLLLVSATCLTTGLRIQKQAELVRGKSVLLNLRAQIKS